VLALNLQADFVSPLEGGEVPFTELIDVGGAGPLSGFRPGRIRGFSAAAATLSYQYPIWVLLDARLFLAAGNAFGEHLEGFDVEDLRLAFGLSIQPRLPGGVPFDLQLAFGTETFARGADVISVRFVIGNWNRL
jgi:outer membrane protein assembly factor BamA